MFNCPRCGSDKVQITTGISIETLDNRFSINTCYACGYSDNRNKCKPLERQQTETDLVLTKEGFE